MHGLSEETYSKIKKILDKYPEIEIKLFGSRARGDYKYNSDIDLAIVNNPSDEMVLRIRRELNNINIIYTLDIVEINKCSNTKFVENIKREGVKF